jgi:hypothetical protein
MWLKPQEAHEIKVSLLKRELLLTVFFYCVSESVKLPVKLHAAYRHYSTRHVSPDIEPIHTCKHLEI